MRLACCRRAAVRFLSVPRAGMGMWGRIISHRYKQLKSQSGVREKKVWPSFDCYQNMTNTVTGFVNKTNTLTPKPESGKGLTSWLSFVVSNCYFVTFPLVSWVRYGT